MSIGPDLTDWLQLLKGESDSSSDSRMQALLTNPVLPKREAHTQAQALPLPATEAAIRAAMSDTFLYSEIAGRGTDADERAILANADTVMIAGKRRLRMQPTARGDLLNRVADSELYHQILEALSDDDERDFDLISQDEIRRNSAWLRCFLTADFSRLDRSPVSELRAALCARELLVDVKLAPAVPTLGEMLRLLELGELLEPLRILIGSRGGWESDEPVTDRFVGREDELRTLRAFVDELKAKTKLEAFGRQMNRLGEAVGQAITGRAAGAFVISARGGLGKSSLIGKFVLDHAVAARDRFPFAYLDFDRAALQPREPRQLLAEVLRQVALQFTEIAEGASAIRRNLQDVLQDEALRNVQETAATSEWAAATGLLHSLTSERNCAFLLVLDTMEIVQSDSRALSGVMTLVNQLTGPQLPAARVVLAGRADIPELRNRSAHRAEGKLFELKPLEVDEAREMADALGRSLLGTEWNGAWAARLAGDDDDSDTRREPLTIRVAVELVRASEPAKRDALTLEIKEMGEEASDHFVGALYQRRVLDHVRDSEVKKLAWPGLVLRRVTLDLVREVLAEVCELDPAKIEQTFAALSNEAWIVTRYGDALKHQPDLRARTLPLMRRHDREKFEKVNSRAIDFFGLRRANDPQAHAEWLYHRLLAGETPRRIQPELGRELVPLLAGAEADFLRGSPAADYLFAETASRLSPHAVQHMDPSYAMQHIANTAPYLGDFAQETLTDLLCDFKFEDVDDFLLDGNGLTAYRTLLIKTGRWTGKVIERMMLESLELEVHAPDSDWSRAYEFAGHFFEAHAHRRPHPKRWLTKDNFSAIIQCIALLRAMNEPSNEAYEAVVREALATGGWQPISDGGAALRTAAAFCRALARPVLRYWYERSRSARPGLEMPAPLNSSYSCAEIRALDNGELSQALRKTDRRLWERIFHNDGEDAGVTIRPEIIAIVDGQLREYLSRDDARSVHALRRFAAARDLEWLTPLAYAAHRAALHGVIPIECTQRADSYDIEAQPGFLVKITRSRRREFTDMLDLLHTADRAGDLANMMRVLVDATANSPHARDLRFLFEHYLRWRERLQQILKEDAPHDDDHRPLFRNA